MLFFLLVLVHCIRTKLSIEARRLYTLLIILRSESVSTGTARQILPFLYLLICLTGNSVFSAEEEVSRVRISTEYTREVNLYVQELEALERRFGPYDRSLLEPLDALISLHSSVDDFVEINSLLGRQLQLVHVTEGPNAFSQLPILESLIRNNLEINNFESVTNNFENRQYVFLQNPDATVNKSSLPWMILEIGI